VSLIVACLALSGCPEQPAASEDHYPLQPESSAAIADAVKSAKNAKERGQAENIPAQLEAALALYFGSPESPQMPGFTPPKPGTFANAEHPLMLGRRLYKQHCMHCHGYYGAGDGPTAPFLLPRPRNFLFGEFKFTSTREGAKPSHDDLKRTIAQGIQGTMMPAFGPPDSKDPKGDLPGLGIVAGFAGPIDFDLDAVAYYVQVLGMRGELERKLMAVYGQNSEITPDDVVAQEQAVEQSWKDAANQVVEPEKARSERTPDEIAKSVKAGDVLFHTARAQCVTCHGATGLGDGLNPDAPDASKDIWGTPLRPANLTLGIYRGGRRPIDLYRRIHTGIKGNVMPRFGSYADDSDDTKKSKLTSEEIWNLVDYVQSLGFRE
jgi:mono/diheme cytochrome c family protein